jgi:tight adherence protein B
VLLAVGPPIGGRARVSTRMARLVMAPEALPLSDEVVVEAVVPVGERVSSSIWRHGRLLWIVAGILIALLAMAATGSLLLAWTAGVAAALMAWVAGQVIRGRRQALFERQIVPTIGMLSAGMRAGYSLRQALQRVAQDAPLPTATEFSVAVREVELGVGTEDALIGLADRVGGDDYKVLAMMLIVHRRVGGNLAQILEALGETVRQRAEIREEINALTAQQRLATYVLVAMPVVVGILFTLVDPGFMQPLFTTVVGNILLAIATILLLLGFVGIRLAARVEL